jgi:hypothetical protein
MIDLAISVDDEARNVTIVETNYGDHLAAPKWPQDSDFRLVVFSPHALKCDVIPPRELARDIAQALEALEKGRRGTAASKNALPVLTSSEVRQPQS